jgi:hypothetical protein
VRDRSAIELMVLAFTGVIGIILLGTAGAIAWIEIRDPTADTSAASQALLSLVSGILGALLGLLAGRSVPIDLSYRPKHDDDDEGSP